MKLDHVNVRTASVELMRAWYVRVLGLKDGWRPPFPFPGAWLYAGNDPIVHLVGVERTPAAPEAELRLSISRSRATISTACARGSQPRVRNSRNPRARHEFAADQHP